jgi:anti-sigma factor RsiW
VNCNETRALLSAYLDGEINLESSLAVERHLAECSGCAGALRRGQTLSSVLASSAIDYRCPAEVRDHIEATIRQATPAVRRRAPAPVWRWASAAAVLMVACGAVVVTRTLIDGSKRDALLVQQLVAGHVHSLLGDHAIDIGSSDQHVVKPWFTGKLDFAPSVPDLSEKGFELLGGRWEYLDGHDAAALVYARRRHVINLFIWRGAEPRVPANGSGTQQGFQFVRWVQNGMSYAAVSDLNLEELQQFAQEVRQAAPSGPQR